MKPSAALGALSVGLGAAGASACVAALGPSSGLVQDLTFGWALAPAAIVASVCICVLGIRRQQPGVASVAWWIAAVPFVGDARLPSGFRAVAVAVGVASLLGAAQAAAASARTARDVPPAGFLKAFSQSVGATIAAASVAGVGVQAALWAAAVTFGQRFVVSLERGLVPTFAAWTLVPLVGLWVLVWAPLPSFQSSAADLAAVKRDPEHTGSEAL